MPELRRELERRGCSLSADDAANLHALFKRMFGGV